MKATGTAVAAEWNVAAGKDLVNCVSGSKPAAADLSASYKILWDMSNLYVFVKVTDDVKGVSGSNPWDKDGVELYLDPNYSRGTSYQNTDFQYVVARGELTIADSRNHSNSGVKVTQLETTGGYTVIISVPWTTMGQTPSAGKTIGLDVHVNDNDGSGRESKIAWYAKADSSWDNPSWFGAGKLGDVLQMPVSVKHSNMNVGNNLISVNTCKGQLDVTLSSIGSYNAELLGMDGRRAAYTSGTGNSFAMRTADLKGSYILKVTSGSSKVIRNIVLE